MERLDALRAAINGGIAEAVYGSQKKSKKTLGYLDAPIREVCDRWRATKSMSAMKGEVTMSDDEKFEDFKRSLIDENELKYGYEIRGKYGDSAVDASNAKLKGLTREQYDEGERLRHAYEDALKSAYAAADPAGELARTACDLHRRWLCVFYPNYSREYHMGLGEIYVADERFKAYYEKVFPGCAEFLRDAIAACCG